MIRTIYGKDASSHTRELDDAFRLRHNVFVDELGWEALRKPDGREIDQFDDDHAIHQVLYERGRLIAYQRLLPTTRPYIMTSVYPQLCDGEAPCDATVMEWTRLAIDRKHRGKGEMGETAFRMVHAMVETCLSISVTTVLVATRPSMILKFAQCHFAVEPLGTAQAIEGVETVALAAHMDKRTSLRLASLIQEDHARQAG